MRDATAFADDGWDSGVSTSWRFLRVVGEEDGMQTAEVLYRSLQPIPDLGPVFLLTDSPVVVGKIVNAKQLGTRNGVPIFGGEASSSLGFVWHSN